ncbi:hypothetical protein CEXT_694081 [Caerostris extrusa]|uniref:Ribosomal protein L29 n=1 Tax=Caerostris extrusa TaxID=172846 RepID=A0AAV4M3U0_CAEEX|nr:hypothetical protein CEXT_694081 [Caerostris extrusa]
MDEKLILEEKHQVRVNELESEINKLKDEIFQLKIDHENAIINQRLQHGKNYAPLHQRYTKLRLIFLKAKKFLKLELF